MSPLLVALALSAPSFATDIPDDADVAVHLELGKLAGEAEAIWSEAATLLDAWPPIKKLAETSIGVWKGTLEAVQKASRADFTARRAVLTASVDLDAKGGPVYALVLRGGGARAPAEPLEDSFTVDGHPAYRVPGRDWVWTVVAKDTLILGNQRGLQRQLRHARSSPKADAGLAKVAARMRKLAPVSLAFSFSEAARAFAGKAFPNGGPLIAAMRSGSLRAHPERVELRFDTEAEKQRDAVEHGVRALGALLNAATALLEGGAEAVLGLDMLGKRPSQVPAALEAATIKGLVAEWLHGARFETSVRRRKPFAVEATIKSPGPRPLLAAMALLGSTLLPSGGGPGQAEAQVMLMALRQAQLAHKKGTGKYHTCGPVPQEMPIGRVDWPSTSCFDVIQFRPPGKVRFQLASAEEGGTLVMMARGDTDGDGVPEVWLLDEKSPAVERFVPPTPDPNEP